MPASVLAPVSTLSRGLNRCLYWILAGCCLLSAPPAGASDAQEGHKLLAAMSDAIRSLDYQGSFIYQHSGRIDTLRVFHAGGGNERERLVSLNGPARELFRNGSSVTCIEADGSAISYASDQGKGLLPLVPAATAPSLEEHYAIRLAGTDRVAGYLADVVDVQPRDGFRYGYRIWLERDSHLLLRSMVLDHRNQLLEQFMFVAIEIGRMPSDADLIPRQTGRLVKDASSETEVEMRHAPNFRVTGLPPGFTLISARRPSGTATTSSEHLVFSDGLASVSLYIEAHGDKALDLTTFAGRGTLNVQAFSRDGVRYTVLGDVPMATVNSIAGSIEPVNESALQDQSR